MNSPLKRSLPRSIFLHLFPGLLTLIWFACFSTLIARLQIPSMLVAPLSVLIGSLPFQVGYLLFQGKKLNGKFSLRGVVSFQERLKVGEYIFYTLLSLGWMALILLLIGLPVKAFLIEKAFFWIPETFVTYSDLSHVKQFPTPSLPITMSINFVVIGLVAPVIEELYFRGHLLPNLSSLGIAGPILNAGLFAMYHFATPWDIPMIFLAYLLPIVLVWKKRNVYLGVIVHSLTNLAAGLSTIWAIASSAGAL